MNKIFSVFLLLSSIVIGQTTLSGNIGGMVIRASGNPWVVTNNIFIEKDSKTIIKPGCIFLFKPFSGLEVHGSLIVEGKETHRVIFTSINDSIHNKASAQKPGPFEWNGIKIHEDAIDINLSNFMLSYSVYGIQSKITGIKIQKGYFRENGQFNFTVGGKIIYVENNFPFNYSSNPEDFDNFYPIRKIENKRKYSYFTIGSITLGAIFLGASGYYIYKLNEYDNKYAAALYMDDIDHYYNRRKESRNRILLSSIAGGVFTSVGLKFLLFDRKIDKKNGIMVSCNREGFNILIPF